MQTDPTPPRIALGRFAISTTEYAVLSFTPLPANATVRLTPGEREILPLLIAGASNQAIAQARRTSARTVANQLVTLFRKLGVTSRRELATHGQRGGSPK